MNQALIDNLPEEVMVRVLEFLDGKSLKNCALVCKKWSEMIGQNSAVMKKLPLVLVSEKGIIDPQELVRKYHTIQFGMRFSNPSLDFTKHRILENLFSLQGCNLRELELNYIEFVLFDVDLLNKAFESLTMLEVLKFHSSHFADDETESIDGNLAFENLKPHRLPRLKSVVLSASDLNFLRLIGTTQIKSLDTDSTRGVSSRLIDFLADQNELEEFAFRYSKYSILENPLAIEKLKKINFPLKRLSLFSLYRFLGTEEILLMFLNKFANTLEELEIVYSYPDSVYIMVFKNFLKLKTFDVNIDDAPKDAGFYQFLRPNPSVQKLVIRGSPFKFASAFEGFIGNLPNVKELVQSKMSQAQMIFVANNLKLESLKLHFVSNQMFNDVSMPSVKSLSILRLSPLCLAPKDWEALTAAMPNIEKFSVLEICGADAFNNSFNIFTKKWLRLKHIKLGEGFVAEKRVFDEMLNNCHNLRIVEIREDAFDQPSEKEAILRDFKSNDVRLIIHKNHEPYRA